MDKHEQGNTGPIRLLLVDDHALVGDLVAAHLRVQGFSVETVASLAQARQALADHGPFDLVLLDYVLPDCSGIADSAGLIASNGGRPVVLFSGLARPETVTEAMAAGFAGYIPKSTAAQALAMALRQVHAGQRWLPEGFDATGRGALRLPAPLDSLTRREREVLRAIRHGRMNKEIGAEMQISEVTVKMHVRAICQKLGVRNRTQAAMIAGDLPL